jgi:hypothetical protein
MLATRRAKLLLPEPAGPSMAMVSFCILWEARHQNAALQIKIDDDEQWRATLAVLNGTIKIP